MEDQTHKIESVDRYLAGKMEEHEKAAFESLIDSDEKLGEYVKEVLRAKATTHLAGREAWKEGLREDFGAKSD